MILSTYDIFECATPILDIPIVEYQYSYPGFIASSSCSPCSRTYFSLFYGVRRELGRAFSDTLCRCARAELTLRLIQPNRSSTSCLTPQASGKLNFDSQQAL